jgi:hypothetical protein
MTTPESFIAAIGAGDDIVSLLVSCLPFTERKAHIVAQLSAAQQLNRAAQDMLVQKRNTANLVARGVEVELRLATPTRPEGLLSALGFAS